MPRTSHEPERRVGTFPYLRVGATALETIRQMVGCMLRIRLVCVVGAKPLVEWSRKVKPMTLDFTRMGIAEGNVDMDFTKSFQWCG